MHFHYEELDYRPTPMGDLMLRRRRVPQFGDLDIYEVKLGESFLMSSLFYEAEHQLATLGLAAVSGDELNVVVGGLGLGYTAVAALQDERVKSLVVIDYLAAVIEWHKLELVPLGKTMNADPRCRYAQADFFELARRTETSLDPAYPDHKHDAILLDIDHTPTNVLRQANTRFYTEEGLREVGTHLRPGGVFALWSDGEPEEYFTQRLASVFASAEAHLIEFDNPLTGGTAKGTVYVAKVLG